MKRPDRAALVRPKVGSAEAVWVSSRRRIVEAVLIVKPVLAQGWAGELLADGVLVVVLLSILFVVSLVLCGASESRDLAEGGDGAVGLWELPVLNFISVFNVCLVLGVACEAATLNEGCNGAGGLVILILGLPAVCSGHQQPSGEEDLHKEMMYIYWHVAEAE